MLAGSPAVRPRRSITTFAFRSSLLRTPDAMAKIEKLVGLVKERSFLFDLNDLRYKDRKLKRQAWEEIAREMGSHDANAWYNRWKSLRDNYGKYKKNANSSTGVYKKYKRWPWAKLVGFLDNYNSFGSRKMPCHRNMTEQNADFSNDISENVNNGDDLNNPVRESLQSDSEKKNEPGTQEHNQIDTSKIDGVDYFFLSYAQSFKNLPTRMQIMLKLEIATLFSRYELQAEGVSNEAINDMTRIVPEPVKSECFFFNTMEEV